MSIRQNLVAAVGFILCLPFVALWVLLAMVRGRKGDQESDGGPPDDRLRPAWLARLARRDQPAGTRGGPGIDHRLAYLGQAEAESRRTRDRSMTAEELARTVDRFSAGR
jgi:hypothetical protein